jgi:sugar/nucleoside kinase (ribokinase family)
VALAHRDGERSFFPDFRANAAVTSISPDSLDWQYVKVLVVSGYSLINLATRSWAESMLQAAVARNVATVVDPASSAPLADVPTDVLQRWFDLADYVIPNEQEFELLRARAALPERSVVIEKRGAAGVRLVRNNHTVQEFAAEAAHVIDTIGAGDAFVGGFAAYLATDHSLEDSILAGLHTARQAVEIRGAQPAE